MECIRYHRLENICVDLETFIHGAMFIVFADTSRISISSQYKKLHFFVPIGAETLGPFGLPHAVQFLEDLGNKISNINDERRSKSFRFQSIAIAIQRGNASCELPITNFTYNILTQ
jgi:hypothetical protein